MEGRGEPPSFESSQQPGFAPVIARVLSGHHIVGLRLQAPPRRWAALQGCVRAHVRLAVSRSTLAAFTDPVAGHAALWAYDADWGRLQTRTLITALSPWIRWTALDADWTDSAIHILACSLASHDPPPVRTGRSDDAPLLIVTGGWIDLLDLRERRVDARALLRVRRVQD